MKEQPTICIKRSILDRRSPALKTLVKGCSTPRERTIEMSTSGERWRRKTNHIAVSLPPLRGDVVEQALINGFGKVVGQHVRKDTEFFGDSNLTLDHLQHP